MSEEEFRAFIQKNPGAKLSGNHLTINGKGGKTKLDKGVSGGCAQLEALEPSSKNKYGNCKVYEYDNGMVSDRGPIEQYGKPVAVYDSIKEYNRWYELLTLQRAGKVKCLRRQVPMLIQDAFGYRGKKIAAITYVADFVYSWCGSDEVVVEDVKPFDEKTSRFRTTKDFRLKWKLLMCRYPEYSFEMY